MREITLADLTPAQDWEWTMYRIAYTLTEEQNGERAALIAVMRQLVRDFDEGPQ